MLFSPKTTNAQVSKKLLGYQVQTSLYGTPIPIGYGTRRLSGNVIWSGDWVATPIKQGGKGGSKGGGKGGGGTNQQYNYQTAIIIALCHGSIQGIGNAWLDRTKLTVATSSEPFTIPGGGGSYTVTQHANFSGDMGGSRGDSYSVVASDYGSPGSVTLSGTQKTPLQKVGGSPGAGQYSQSGGTYTFSAADAGKTVQITYTWTVPTTAGSITPITNLSLTLFTGSQGQSPWGYLTGKHPDQALGYTQLAYVANPAMQLGQSGLVSNLSLEVTGLLPFGGGVIDAEPSAVITDFLSNPFWGAGFPQANLGDLTELSSYCTANGYFISPLIDSQATAAEHLKEWLLIANSECVWSDGLLKFRSYGDTTAVGNGATFHPNTQPIYDLDDDDFKPQSGAEPIVIERPSVRDAYNSVSVEWTDRSNNYNQVPLEEKDDWAIAQFKLRPAPPLKINSVCQHSIAQAVANTQLKRSVYVRNTYRFRLGWQYSLLEPMDLVTVTDPGLGLIKAPVRILSIEEDDQFYLSITAEDFPWGTATPTLNGKQVTGSFGPGYFADPGNVNAPIFFEATPEMTQEIGFVLNIGLSGGPNWGGTEVWESIDNATYTNIGLQTGPSTMGVLTSGLAASNDPDDSNTLAVDLTQSLGTLPSYSADQENAFQSLILVDGEIMAYRTASLTAPYHYNITHLRRGVFGSTITPHLAGAPFVVLNNAMFEWIYDPTEVGKLHYFKFTSVNQAGQQQQDLSTVQPFTYRLRGPRVPYPWYPATSPGPADNLFGAVSKLGVQLAYDPPTDGSRRAMLNLSGRPPQNRYSKAALPPSIALSTSSTGGSIPGGSTVVVGMQALGSDSLYSAMSDLQYITIPVGTNTNKVTAAITSHSASYLGGLLFAGLNDDGKGLTVAASSGLSLTADIISVDYSGITAPDSRFDHFVVRAWEDVHAGVYANACSGATGTVTGVSDPFTVAFGGANFTPNQFANGTMSLLGKGVDAGFLTQFNVRIISHDATTFTLAADPTAWGIQAGDILVIRSQATSATPTSITNSNWANNGGSGLTAHAEIGNFVWIISGTDAGDIVPILDNTATAITVANPFKVTPDTTSVFIVVGPAVLATLVSSQFQVSSNGWSVANLKLPIDNTRKRTYVVKVFTADAAGDMSLDGPFNEIFVPGKMGTGQQIADGYFIDTPVSGHITPDLANGLNHEVILNGALVVNNPVFSNGTFPPGGYLSLIFVQPNDGTGQQPTPTFGGNFIGVPATFSVDGTPNTYTTINFDIRADGKFQFNSYITGSPR